MLLSRTQASIYDGAFLWIYLTAYYFRNKISIVDVWLVYIWAFRNIEIFQAKLRWSNSWWLLQRTAFLVFLFFFNNQPLNGFLKIGALLILKRIKITLGLGEVFEEYLWRSFFRLGCRLIAYSLLRDWE